MWQINFLRLDPSASKQFVSLPALVTQVLSKGGQLEFNELPTASAVQLTSPLGNEPTFSFRLFPIFPSLI